MYRAFRETAAFIAMEMYENGDRRYLRGTDLTDNRIYMSMAVYVARRWQLF